MFSIRGFLEQHQNIKISFLLYGRSRSGLRRAIANSTRCAVVSGWAVIAFKSRYALRLYTLLSLKAGLRRPVACLSRARKQLGVPPL